MNQAHSVLSKCSSLFCAAALLPPLHPILKGSVLFLSPRTLHLEIRSSLEFNTHQLDALSPARPSRTRLEHKNPSIFDREALALYAVQTFPLSLPS